MEDFEKPCGLVARKESGERAKVAVMRMRLASRKVRAELGTQMTYMPLAASLSLGACLNKLLPFTLATAFT